MSKSENALKLAKSIHEKQGVMPHAGPIHSVVAGRTDHLPMHVSSGSYVIPADIISAMGEGNTVAGFKHAKIAFSGSPYSSGLYDQNSGDTPYSSGEPYGVKDQTVYDAQLPKKDGGGVSLAPIVAAGGEYVLTPEEVINIGKGSLEDGHRILDLFVTKMRGRTIKTLKALPGPKRD